MVFLTRWCRNIRPGGPVGGEQLRQPRSGRLGSPAHWASTRATAVNWSRSRGSELPVAHELTVVFGTPETCASRSCVSGMVSPDTGAR